MFYNSFQFCVSILENRHHHHRILFYRTNLSSKISGNRNKSTVSSQMEDEERARIQANQNVTRLWKNVYGTLSRSMDGIET